MVLFVYVDDSNVWIEGRHLEAVRLGLALGTSGTARAWATARWSYDFGRRIAALRTASHWNAVTGHALCAAPVAGRLKIARCDRHLSDRMACRRCRRSPESPRLGLLNLPS
jgi:hypothetical protein